MPIISNGQPSYLGGAKVPGTPQKVDEKRRPRERSASVGDMQRVCDVLYKALAVENLVSQEELRTSAIFQTYALQKQSTSKTDGQK